MEFAQLVASADGRNLYGVDAGTRDRSRPPALFRISTKSGTVLRKRDLPIDVWNISVARLHEELIPRGRVSTTPCQNPNAGLSK